MMLARDRWPIALILLLGAQSASGDDCLTLFSRLMESVPSFRGLTASIEGDVESDPELAKWMDLKLREVNFGSSNHVYLAEDADGTTLAIFKLDSITSPLIHFFDTWDLFTGARTVEKGGLRPRGVAASDLNRALDFSVMPATGFAATGEGKKGTMQAFLKGYVTGKEARSDLVARNWIYKVRPAQVQEAVLLDALLGSSDRHLSNWMINEEGDLKLIDSDQNLYLTRKRRWKPPLSDFLRSFPQGQGKVEPDVAARFLAMPRERLGQLLRARGIPEKAIEYAQARLLSIQEDLRKGHSAARIARDHCILAKLTYVKGAVLLVTGGAAGKLILDRMSISDSMR